MASLAPDPRDWTPDQLMECISLAIRAKDFEAVPHLITLLAFKDAHLAETVHGSMMAVLTAGRSAVAREGGSDDDR
jgi:hypothetical protein